MKQGIESVTNFFLACAGVHKHKYRKRKKNAILTPLQAPYSVPYLLKLKPEPFSVLLRSDIDPELQYTAWNANELCTQPSCQTRTKKWTQSYQIIMKKWSSNVLCPPVEPETDPLDRYRTNIPKEIGCFVMATARSKN